MGVEGWVEGREGRLVKVGSGVGLGRELGVMVNGGPGKGARRFIWFVLFGFV